MKHEDIEEALAVIRKDYDGLTFDADRTLVRTLLLELAALRERGRWREIESAPTRTFVLVAFADGRRPEISRHDKASHVSLYGWLDYSTLDGEDIEFYRDGPTHWLPLPEAPR